MHRNKKEHLLAQIQRFRRRFAQSAGGTLIRVIPKDAVLRWIREEVGPYRERLYGPFRTLGLFIEQVLSPDHSCQDAVARGLSARVALGEPPARLDTGGYCRARARLPLALPARAAREVGASLSRTAPQAWRWRGSGGETHRRDHGVDAGYAAQPAPISATVLSGPGVWIPACPARRDRLAQLGGSPSVGVGPGAGKGTGEMALLWRLKATFRPADVVIADRYYTSYFLISALLALGVDVVFRQHGGRSTDFRTGTRLGARDHLARWERPARPAWMDEATYAEMPETLCLREVRIGGYTLVSTFTSPREVHKQELLRLYRNRWHLELDLRSIKAVMQMEVLRCKTPEMVEKEIAVHFLAYNLVRTVMARAAVMSEQLPRQLSFKGTLQLLNTFETSLRHCPRGALEERTAELLHAVAQCRLAYRPNRVEPRLVKRRPHRTRWLQEPRHVWRTRLRRKQTQRRRQCA